MAKAEESAPECQGALGREVERGPVPPRQGLDSSQIVACSQQVEQLDLGEPEPCTGDQAEAPADEVRVRAVLPEVCMPAVENAVEQRGQVRRREIPVGPDLQLLVPADLAQLVQHRPQVERVRRGGHHLELRQDLLREPLAAQAKVRRGSGRDVGAVEQRHGPHQPVAPAQDLETLPGERRDDHPDVRRGRGRQPPELVGGAVLVRELVERVEHEHDPPLACSLRQPVLERASQDIGPHRQLVRDGESALELPQDAAHEPLPVGALRACCRCSAGSRGPRDGPAATAPPTRPAEWTSRTRARRSARPAARRTSRRAPPAPAGGPRGRRTPGGGCARRPRGVPPPGRADRAPLLAGKAPR